MTSATSALSSTLPLNIRSWSKCVSVGGACCSQDDDPYVRKTAAVCVAKLFDINPELVEDRGFLDMLRVRSSAHCAVQSYNQHAAAATGGIKHCIGAEQHLQQQEQMQGCAAEEQQCSKSSRQAIECTRCCW
jgi:hypothetical protein